MRATSRRFRRAFGLAPIAAQLGLCACGGGGTAVTTEAGASPFISMMHVQDVEVSDVATVEYTIAPKPGTVSKAVHVEYSEAALQKRGYTSLDGRSLTIPVFGLYAGYNNQVSVRLHMRGGATTPFEVNISTAEYVDPSGIYSQPNVLTARASGSTLGFDFIYIKSALGSPVIIDTDAQIRWVAPGVSNSTSSSLGGDLFTIGDPASRTVRRMRLDGTVTQGELEPSTYTAFNHDIQKGKRGLIAEVEALTDGVASIQSNVIEMDDSGSSSVLSHWDLGAILSAYMTSQADDAAAFVRPGVDWFHSNSAIYDPRDDSVIVSSRENFVIKLDYATGAIAWILGDPTKYWYTFPSLRAKALTLAGGGLYPIGQHALSITSDGLLMLFNDGLQSLNQPAGASAGQGRSYSAVSAYSIDPASMTAQQVWEYDAAIFSSLCSSVYEAPGQSLLVDYAYADTGTRALVVGLDADRHTVFSIEYPTSGCNTSWNAQPVSLDDLKIEE